MTNDIIYLLPSLPDFPKGSGEGNGAKINTAVAYGSRPAENASSKNPKREAPSHLGPLLHPACRFSNMELGLGRWTFRGNSSHFLHFPISRMETRREITQVMMRL